MVDEVHAEKSKDGLDGYDLRRWIERMRDAGELIDVRGYVDPEEEMAALTYMVGRTRGAPSLLFSHESTGDVQARHLWNMIGSSRTRLQRTLNYAPRGNYIDFIRHIRSSIDQRLDPVVVSASDAPVLTNSIVGDDIDLTSWPFPKHWPKDGGRYAGTADAVVTSDPISGVVNVGTYRMMVQGRDRVGIYVSPGKDARRHFERVPDASAPIPIAAVWGLHPVIMMAASQHFDEHTCEYDVVGALTGEPLSLVNAPVTGLPVPAAAEVVMEGEIVPSESMDEGPFGEFTGYYGAPRNPTWFIHVKALHFRNSPILTAALMSDSPSNEMEGFYSTLKAARIWAELEAVGLRGLKGVYCHPAAASGFAMTVVSIEQGFPGHAEQALNLAAHVPSGAYFTKWVIVVDEDIDPSDFDQVIWAMSTRCAPARGVALVNGTWNTELDPAINPPELRRSGSRVLIDACTEFRYRNVYSERTRPRRDVYDCLRARWHELGMPGLPPTLPSLMD